MGRVVQPQISLLGLQRHFCARKCRYPPDTWSHILRPVDDPDFPWTGVIFGMVVGSIWYWCTDQVIVQRTLSAKDLSNGKLGCVCAAMLKILPVFLMLIPGMISRALWPNEIACKTPEACQAACQSDVGCTNIAYPTLVMRILPNGLKGLLLAVMLAALMSSLTATFNSGSTLFTMDIWKRFRKNAKATELILVGRLFMLVLIAISILWIPFVANSNSGQLFDYIQSVSNFLCPPIAVVFTMAVFWERTTEAAAFWGLTTGLMVGGVRMFIEFASSAPGCGDADDRPKLLSKVHYLHFSLVLTAVVAVIVTSISLLTPPIPRKHLRRLTYWTRFHPKARESLSMLSLERHRRMELMKGDDEKDAEQAAESGGCLKCLVKEGEDEGQKDVLNVEGHDITEERSWMIAANVGAVVVTCTTCFLFGYFA